MRVDSADFEILDETECRRLLGTLEVGRVAVTIAALPAIFPVTFRFADDRVLFYTGEGTKLTAALHKAVVAFEVDALDPETRSGWSVHVLGIARISDSTADQIVAETAELEPWASAGRPRLVVVRAERITGRRITGRRLSTATAVPP